MACPSLQIRARRIKTARMPRILFLAFFLQGLALASPPQTSAPADLTAVQRSRLREKLYDFWSDVNLTLRNRKINSYDITRQEREMDEMGVFDKVPLGHCPASLEERLRASAKRFGLYLSQVRRGKRRGTPRPVPRWLFVDQGSFHLAPDQLVDPYDFDLRVRGLESSLKDWSVSWTRLPEPSPPSQSAEPADSPYLEAASGPVGSAPWRRIPSRAVIPRWKVRLRGYCFRDVRFPRLILRDPVALLPGWARRDPGRFAREEPLLWSTIEKTRALIPDARPLYATHERFLLNDARLSFFLQKMGQTPVAGSTK